MSIGTVRHDHDRRLTIVELHSAATYADILDILREEVEPDLQPNIIWIINAGTLAELSTDDLKSLIVMRKDVLERRRGGHAIFVAVGNVERTLLRWYLTFGESVAKAPMNLHLCRSLDEAIAIIDEDSSGSSAADGA